MTESERGVLTLDRPARYQIIVPGIIAEKWFLDYPLDELSSAAGQDGKPWTVITTTVDQAALHGLLRYLYTLRLPLIAVRWIDPLEGDQPGNQA